MKKVITDTLGWMSSYSISESEKGGPLVIEGNFGSVDQVNGNKRLYSRSVMENALEKKRDVIENRGMYGEIDHPRDAGGEMRLGKASHLITSLSVNEDGTMPGKLQVIDGPYGHQLEAIARAGGRIGLSTRGLGSTKKRKDDGVEVVGEDFELITVDVVANPSAPGAFGAIAEDVEQEKETTMPDQKRPFKTLRDVSEQLLSVEVRGMSESERRRATKEIDEVIVELELNYLDEAGHRTLTHRLINKLQDRAEEIRSSRIPTPNKMLEAASQVVEHLKGKMEAQAKVIAKLQRKNEELETHVEVAEAAGEEAISQLQAARREAQLAEALGEKLLERAKKYESQANKRPVKKIDDSKGSVRDRVDVILDEKEYLVPMREQLNECEDVPALKAMISKLDRFYEQAQHPMLEDFSGGRKVRRKRSGRRLSEAQKADVLLLNRMEQYAGAR